MAGGTLTSDLTESGPQTKTPILDSSLYKDQVFLLEITAIMLVELKLAFKQLLTNWSQLFYLNYFI